MTALLMTHDLPAHWAFAFGNAVARLRELVRAFDFIKATGGHVYAGIEPAKLVEFIDGFLAEPFIIRLGGNRTDLINLRQTLIERIIPAYESGVESGKRRWQTGNQILGELDTNALHELALKLAPADPQLSGWFAEGFCVAYSYAEMESLRPSK